MGKLILLIEDDVRLGEQIVARLRLEGFEVVWRTEGRLLEPRELDGVALVILDLLLPGTYGLDILREIRAHTDTPFLILSARDDTHDKVHALRLGADDYMTKPFWPDELVERVRARLRRPAISWGDTISVGALRVDLAARRIEVGETAVELTRVRVRARRRARPQARRGAHAGVADRARPRSGRRGHRARPRRPRVAGAQKLGPAVRIETVWGIGYRLAAGGAR